VNLYEFHVTVFATLFLSLMFYCFIKEDFRGFVLFMILSLLCQENMPLIIIPVGAYAFFAKRPKRWALVPVLSGLIWFWATVYKVMPYFNRDTIQFFRIYGHLGDSIPEIARSVLSNPIGAASGIMTRMDIFYLLSLSVPVCFLCLLDLRILIILPVLMQHLFSARLWEHTIFYHYTAEMLPVIFISTIYGIKRFFTVDFVKNNIRQGMFIGLFLTVAVTSSICFGGGLDLLANRKDITRDILDCQKERFIGMVPEDAGVVATFEFLPKLSRRKHLYSFHHIVDGAYTLSDRPYSLPENTEYALLDFNDSLTFDRFHPYFGCFIDFYDRGVSDANMRNFLKESDWGIIESAGSIVLLKKGHSSRHKLFQTLSRLPRISNHVGATAAGEVELIGYDVDRMDKQGAEQVKLTFFWKALNNDRGDYGCFLYIIGKDGCIISEIIKPICYRVYPSYAWREGEIVKEDYNLILPQEVKGGYIIRMGLFEYKDKDKRVLRFDSLSSDAVDDKGLVSIKI